MKKTKKKFNFMNTKKLNKTLPISFLFLSACSSVPNSLDKCVQVLNGEITDADRINWNEAELDLICIQSDKNPDEALKILREYQEKQK